MEKTYKLVNNLPENILDFRGIAFKGGGVKGIAHSGVVQGLEEIGLLAKLTHFIGSSAGSIVAGLCACRLSAETIKEISLALDFKKLGDRGFFFKDLYDLTTTWGCCENIGGQIYTAILEKYVGNGAITFKEVLVKFDSTLIITTTDINFGETLYYDHVTNPDMPIAEAVRRSINMPWYYSPIQSDNHYFIDGGLLNNYPIKHLYKYLPKNQVIGSCLVSSSQLENQLKPINTIPKNFIDYSERILEILLNKAMSVHVPEKEWQRTIAIDTMNISSTDFDIKMDQKNFLIQQGIKAFNDYLKSFNEIKQQI